MGKSRLIDPRYSACRSFGHAWRRAWTVEREPGGVALILRCTGCPTERRDLYAPRSGELLARSYTYPEGYGWRRPEGDKAPAPDRASYRAEFLGDLLAGHPRSGEVVDLRTARRSRSA